MRATAAATLPSRCRPPRCAPLSCCSWCQVSCQTGQHRCRESGPCDARPEALLLAPRWDTARLYHSDCQMPLLWGVPVLFCRTFPRNASGPRAPALAPYPYRQANALIRPRPLDVALLPSALPPLRTKHILFTRVMAIANYPYPPGLDAALSASLRCRLLLPQPGAARLYTLLGVPVLSPGAFLAGVALPALATGQLPDGVQALLLTHIQVGVHNWGALFRAPHWCLHSDVSLDGTPGGLQLELY